MSKMCLRSNEDGPTRTGSRRSRDDGNESKQRELQELHEERVCFELSGEEISSLASSQGFYSMYRRPSCGILPLCSKYAIELTPQNDTCMYASHD